MKQHPRTLRCFVAGFTRGGDSLAVALDLQQGRMGASTRLRNERIYVVCRLAKEISACVSRGAMVGGMVSEGEGKRRSAFRGDRHIPGTVEGGWRIGRASWVFEFTEI